MTMESFEFVLVLSEEDSDQEGLEDRIFEAGCDDATLALLHGALTLHFVREASRFQEAVLSAIADVEQAGLGVARMEPDNLVSQSEIAARSGLTRAAVSLYEKGARGEGFPRPVARITTMSPLWDWVDVSRWLWARGQLDEEVCRSALVARVINAHLGAGFDSDVAQGEIDRVLAAPLAA